MFIPVIHSNERAKHKFDPPWFDIFRSLMYLKFSKKPKGKGKNKDGKIIWAFSETIVTKIILRWTKPRPHGRKHQWLVRTIYELLAVTGLSFFFFFQKKNHITNIDDKTLSPCHINHKMKMWSCMAHISFHMRWKKSQMTYICIYTYHEEHMVTIIVHRVDLLN